MLSVRPVTEADSRVLWEWANDPVVRAWAFDASPITWEEHCRWFAGKRANPGCAMYLILRDGAPAGQVRFDVQPDGAAEIDISLAPEARGRGLGAEALERACEAFELLGKARVLIAVVKPDNAASRRVFTRAGFAEQASGPHAVRFTRPARNACRSA